MQKTVILLISLIFLAGIDVSAKKKTDYRNAIIMAYSPVNSIFEDENIILQIYDEQLWARNRTSNPIFIDLSQSFIINNGTTIPIIDTKKAKKNKKNDEIESIITLPPSTGLNQMPTFICQLSGPIFGKYTTSETPSGNFSLYDKRLLNVIDELATESLQSDPKGKEYIGTASKHLMEDESISSLGASIAYSLNKNSDEWENVIISTWVCDVIFTPYYIELPKDLSKKEKRGFGVKETDNAQIHVKADSPFEFEADRAPLIIADWVGDYKKGTFTLDPIRVSKVKKSFGQKMLSNFLFGSGSKFVPLFETVYKSEIDFDGSNANWGELKYVDEYFKTKQKE